ncbi:MAG: hypothetical protein AB7D24_11825 [Sphaerochaeta sp.]|uniref:hypothetical protein n=2 Tax=unclassified Sphaerochaeta TaxID=2637943 RepID=UPI0026143D2C|nr:hypothetical protein [Sphaerochaeta sp.]MDX9825441.1 hypothetical protein [Sphaerochaeta sp.]
MMDLEAMYEANLNPHKDVLSRQEYRKLFGHTFTHPFTGLDYIDLYMDLAVDNNIEVVLANHPRPQAPQEPSAEQWGKYHRRTR